MQMSADQYPLTKAAGLQMWDADGRGKNRHMVVDADVIEAWLAGAPWSPHVPEGWPTHQARLVCIEPLVRDSAEQFIREWVAYEEEQMRKDGPYVSSRIPKFIERAKKLLGEK
jgi:hypothetical protein